MGKYTDCAIRCVSSILHAGLLRLNLWVALTVAGGILYDGPSVMIMAVAALIVVWS